MPFVEANPSVLSDDANATPASRRPEYTPAKRRGQAPAPKPSRRSGGSVRWFLAGSILAVGVFLVGLVIAWMLVSDLFEAV
jgi:hypothetical protein